MGISKSRRITKKKLTNGLNNVSDIVWACYHCYVVDTLHQSHVMYFVYSILVKAVEIWSMGKSRSGVELH